MADGFQTGKFLPMPPCNAGKIIKLHNYLIFTGNNSKATQQTGGIIRLRREGQSCAALGILGASAVQCPHHHFLAGMNMSLFNLPLPIIQAPMAGSQDSRLALAVCAAGALGSLPAAMLSIDTLQQHLQALAACGKPYNVNFFCHTPPAPDAEREAVWQNLLAPYYAEQQISPGGTAVARKPFDTASAELLAHFKPAVVSFHFGLPEPALLEAIRAWGGKILSSATTVAEARWLRAQGVDAVIAQGLEAGGHRGMFLSPDLHTQIGSFALLPQVVKAVDCPVIAAGGIVDAQGVRAAFALGAQAVQAGTAFLLCDEAGTSAVHRAALRAAQADPAAETALTNLFSGRPARGLVNRLMRELGPLNQAAPAFPLAGNALAALRAHMEKQGIGDFSPLWSGQNLSGCKAVPACEIVAELARGVPV